MGTVCPVKTVVLPPCVAPAAAPPVPAPAPVPAAVPPAAAAPIAVTTPAAPPCDGVLPLLLTASNTPCMFVTSKSKSACSSSDTPSLLPCAAAAFALFKLSVAIVTSLGFASPAMVMPAPTVAGIGRGMTLVSAPGSKICPMFVATLLRPCAGSLTISHAPVAADLTTLKMGPSGFRSFSRLASFHAARDFSSSAISSCIAYSFGS